MISSQRIEKIQQFLRQPWVIALALALCLVPWFITRVEMLYIYQTPPAQTTHPNYFTFHEMSQSWIENKGKYLGEIDLNRMYVNAHRLSVTDYIKDNKPGDQHCMYLSLDPGLAIIITAARAAFPGLADSYLRLVTLQVILDGVMMLVLFLTFLRMGLLPTMSICIAYALNTVFAYNAIFPFQYFWEGWLVGAAILLLIWARRCILARRRWWPIILIVLAGFMMGFTLWVRSSALVVVIALILTFMFTPSLRRYCGMFFLAFALCMAPQIVRASSAYGHFALSTRMSWHTAYQALGHYPNKYGLEDDDLYVFTKSQNEDGVKYDYCDYRPHDEAIKKDYLDLWHRDPGYIVRSIAGRIVNGILFNSDLTASNFYFLGLFILAFVTLLLAVRLGGEALFISGLMGLVYIGYCTAVGIVYSMNGPYAYVAQLSLIYFLPVFIAGGLRVISAPRAAFQALRTGHGLQRLAFWTLLCVLMIGAGAGQIPSVRHYLFPPLPHQAEWIIYGAPNHKDNDRLVEEWENLPKPLQQAFLKLVHSQIPPSAVPRDDVSRYFTNNYATIGYTDYDDHRKLKTIFTLHNWSADASLALLAVMGSVQGMDIDKISIIDLKDPKTWDGRTIHVTLLSPPERAGVDYQTLATQKFNRYNFDVTWHGPDEFTAHHRGWGCDAIRHVLAVFYGGYCPYDPHTGPNPYD